MVLSVIEVSNVFSVEDNGALLRVVEALHHLNDRGLARATFAHEGDEARTVLTHFERYAIERDNIWLARIRKLDVIECQISSRCGRIDGLLSSFLLPYRWLRSHYLEHFLCGAWQPKEIPDHERHFEKLEHQYLLVEEKCRDVSNCEVALSVLSLRGIHYHELREVHEARKS